MSFVLPGNQRSLRFTGEAKALVLPKDGSAAPSPPSTSRGNSNAASLGKPRVRKPSAPPALGGHGTPSSFPPRLNTPTPGAGPVSRPPRSNPYGEPSQTPYLGAHNAPVIRHSSLDDSDEYNSTRAMDREGLDVLPGGGAAARSVKPGFLPHAHAVPNFRPANANPQNPMATELGAPGRAMEPSSADESQQGRAPLFVWVLASIVIGVLMYFVAPTVLLSNSAPPRTQASASGSAQP